MNKNDVFTGTVTDITSEGIGVIKNGGMAVFVKNTAKGDTVEYKIIKLLKNYAVGRVINIISPSADRTEPDCPFFYRCGGCSFRHISYEAEARIKQNNVCQTMLRIGKTDAPCKEIITAKSTERYRNKAQYPISKNRRTGFFAPRSHDVVEITDCKLQPHEFTVAARVFEQWAKENKVSVYDERKKTGTLRHLYMRKGFKTGEIFVCVVIKGSVPECINGLVNRLKEALGESLKTAVVNINNKDNNVVLGDKSINIFGGGFITDILCGIKVKISPLSFYQVNRDMAEALYNKAKEYANAENKNVLDLYCGTGTIGLSMADKAKSVIGVEIVPEAIENAKENAALNGINNASFICGDAAAAAKELKNKGVSADVVLLDPPRKGCDEELLNTVSQDFKPERIVYVSCNVSTLARDTGILNRSGYRLVEYTPVDLFPKTAHTESVALFVRTDL